MAEEPISEWRDPTPSASSSTSLESHVSVTLRPTKKRHTEDDDDPTYQPRDDEVESARSPNPEQMPVVPRELNFEEEEVSDKEPPAPSPTTSGKSRGQRTKLRRGEHGRHRREIHGEVHVIHEVGPEGNLLSHPRSLPSLATRWHV